MNEQLLQNSFCIEMYNNILDKYFIILLSVSKGIFLHGKDYLFSNEK